MRNYEFFASCVDHETPVFGRVFRAVPADKLDYRPHEKNTAAGDLVFQMEQEITALVDIFETGQVTMGPRKRPDSLDEMASNFERSAKRVAEAARATSDERWRGPAKFLWDGNVAWETTVAEMAWGFLFDLIHHRGQLSVYLRPMGGKVPSIYGPSGDDAGGT